MHNHHSNHSSSTVYVQGDATLISLSRAFSDASDLNSIDCLLRDLTNTFVNRRRGLPEAFFIPILRCYSRLRLPYHAVRLFDKMHSEFRCRPRVRSLNTTLNALISLSLFSHALTFHSRVSATFSIFPNLLTFNLLLKCLCRLSRPDEAVNFFRDFSHLHKSRFSPDVYSYATVMDALTKDGRVDEAVLLLDEMSVEGCQPTEVNFNVVICGLCNNGDVSGAGKIVRHMILKGCVPNQVTYNTIIHGLCSKGKVESAMDLIDCMVKKDCYPNNVTYGTIVDGLVKANRLNDVEQVVALMEQSENASPGLFVYSILISGLFRSGRFDDALRLWTLIIDEKGIKPNAVLYTNLIDGLCVAGKMEEVDKVLVRMKEEDGDCKPNVFTYSSVVRGYFKAKKPDKAIDTWKDMIAAGCKPNQISYSILITGLCETGRLRDGLMVFHQMLAKECVPDVIAYSSMIKGLCDAGRVVEGMRLFYDMSAHGKAKPDCITYNILFTGLCKAKELAGAMGLLGRMVDGGCDGDNCDPDEVTCNVFLSALGGGEKGNEFFDGLLVRLCKRGRGSGVAGIVPVMLQKKYVPIASTWEKVARVLCSNEKVQRNIKKCWGVMMGGNIS
ncbi:putative Pentatricopeptide repeat-containing protein [Zostera marina]|uniref:Putative Pentatricopeptide repeat-containing protein n=1 Tax=Zostera marina TaxID=29655 RepID=A0A0K9P436_ZOSMR|nr:putative Pentatricopeptide repeat-containing protein [Zostera marina]